MAVTDLSKKVNEKITDLFKQIKIVESCDALIEKVQDMNIVFQKENEEGNIDVVDVSNMLSEGQMQNAKAIIIAMLNGNKEDANEVLKQFLEFEPQEKVKKFGDGQDEDEEVKEVKEEENKPKKETQSSKVDIGKMQSLLRAGWKQKDIAEEFGVTPNVIASLVRKHGK